MFKTTATCPDCKRVYELEWDKDTNFKCQCGTGGYWSHYYNEEDQPLHWFWDGEEDKIFYKE